MLFRPGLFDRYLVDRLLETALGNHRYGQPFDAVRGLDAIAVVPMPLHILDTVEHHVFIALCYQVEKALPRYVTGLHDGDAPRLRRTVRRVFGGAVAIGRLERHQRPVWCALARPGLNRTQAAPRSKGGRRLGFEKAPGIPALIQ